jgi:hypothetical protein
MGSTAISAQGTLVQVSSGSGGAKTVSGLALGNPTIVTATAHGFNNGDVVTFASLGGNTTLNGKTLVVKNKTTNTFAVDVDTTGGTAYTTGGTATPSTFTKIGNAKQFNGLDGSASEQDVSNFDSTGKEFILGLYDGGNMTVDLDIDMNDAGQQSARAACQGSLKKTVKFTFPDASTLTFDAFVKKFTITGGVDKTITGQISLRITGAYTVTP